MTAPKRQLSDAGDQPTIAVIIKAIEQIRAAMGAGGALHEARLFGAAAFALKGPGRSTILLGSEVLQEPHRVQGLPGIGIPTTLTYVARVVPGGALPMHGWGVESPRLTVDFGVAQVAGNVAPGINLQARHQFALGITYGF